MSAEAKNIGRAGPLLAAIQEAAMSQQKTLDEMASEAVMEGLVMMRISTTEGWRAEERDNHWSDGGVGLVLGSDTTKVTMREGEGVELLIQGIRDGSMSSWSPSTGSCLWRTPFRVVDFWTNGAYNLAVQTDGVTLVAVEHSSGKILPTPFKLTTSMTNFSAHWAGASDVLFTQPVRSNRRALLWSLKTQTEVATFDDIAAPLTDRERGVNLGPAHGIYGGARTICEIMEQRNGAVTVRFGADVTVRAFTIFVPALQRCQVRFGGREGLAIGWETPREMLFGRLWATPQLT